MQIGSSIFGVPTDIMLAMRKVRDGEPLGDLSLTRRMIDGGYMVEEPTRQLTEFGAYRLKRFEEWANFVTSHAAEVDPDTLGPIVPPTLMEPPPSLIEWDNKESKTDE